MRKYFLISTTLFTIFFSLFLSINLTFAQNSLQYEMVSYTQNNKDASTPFFNLAFFNQPYFTINYQSFSNGFQFLFDLMIGISIATAVIVFMYGAFEGILDRSSTSEKLRGKDRMQSAVVGLMIVLSTWLIINTVNPDLLRLPIFQGLDQLGKTSSTAGSPDTAATIGSH